MMLGVRVFIRRRWRDLLGSFLLLCSYCFLAFVEPMAFPRFLLSAYLSVGRFLGYFGGSKAFASPFLSFYGLGVSSSPLSGWDLSVFWLIQGEALPWALFLSRFADFFDGFVRLAMSFGVLFCLFSSFVRLELRPSKAARGFSRTGLFVMKVRFSFLPKAFDFVLLYLGWFFRSGWGMCFVIVLSFAFSVPSLILDFVSFYFYFMVSFDWLGVLDLLWGSLFTVYQTLSFLPLWGWLILGYVAFRLLRSYFADSRIRAMVKTDRDFVDRNCGVFTLTLGKMRDGKDTVQQSFARNRESLYRSSLQKTMSELRSYFPFFDFEGLERAIVDGMAFGNSQNELRSSGASLPLDPREVHNIQQASSVGLSFLGAHRSEPFWNGCSAVSLRKAVSEYSKAFFVFGYDASLIVGNIPYRCDAVWKGHGFSPLWDDDSLQHAKMGCLSYFTHNVVYDSLRFGRKMDPSSDWCETLGPGIWTFTEFGKEYGNQLTNLNVKATDPTSNSKNDMMDYTFKVGGHVANIWHVNYFSVFANEQRCGSLSGNLVDLAESIIVPDSRGVRKGVALRFWWVEPIVHDFFFQLINPFVLKYRNVRGDFDFFYCLCLIVLDSSVRSTVFVNNRYGFSRRTLHISTSGVDGNLSPVGDEPYFVINCIDFADRFQSDCMGDFLNGKKLSSTKGLFDLPEFKGLMPSKDEWDFQGSHLVSDLEDPLASGRFGQSRDGNAGGEAGKGGPAV